MKPLTFEVDALYSANNFSIESVEFAGYKGCVGLCDVKSEDKDHPNKLPFKGTLLILDEASNKPPHGAEGHRILVPTQVAKKRLKTILNTGLNYAPDLQGHAVRRKVGVITGAWIEGRELKVSGFIWKKDFPEAVDDLHRGGLGMSMELSSVYIQNRNDDVWKLVDFQFSGATVLLKTAAAYFKTALAASRAVLVHQNKEGGHMAKEKEKTAAELAASGTAEVLSRAIAGAVGPAVEAAMAKAMAPITEGFKSVSEGIAAIAAAQEETKDFLLEQVDARGKADDEEEDDDEEADDEEAAAKKSEDDEDDDETDDTDDDDEEDEMDAELEKLAKKPAEQEPGQVNKDAKNRGRKTTVTASGDDKGEKESMLVRSLRASNAEFRKGLGKAMKRINNLKNRVQAMSSQVELYAEATERRSVSPELANLLAKGGVAAADLQAEGRKLTTPEVDRMFEASGLNLDPTTRMSLKNQLYALGLMETGEVKRASVM